MANLIRVGGGGGASIPAEPTSWVYLTNFISTGAYTEASSPGAWIRVWAHGRGGNGGAGGGAYNAKNWGSYGGGGASGSNGAVGCSTMYLKKGETIEIIIDSVKTQIVNVNGTIAYAENGRTGGAGGKGPYVSSYNTLNVGTAGAPNTVAAKAYSFNLYCLDGALGNAGEPGGIVNGTSSITAQGGGGAASAMPTEAPYGSTPTATGGARPTSNTGSSVGGGNPGGNGVYSTTAPVYFGGAGGGGSGLYYGGPSKNTDVGGAGGTGAIGGVVIEKGV